MASLKIYTWIVVGIFLWWLVNSIYLGVVTPPSEGDSLFIHIHQAEKILNGTIFSLDYTKDLFYPASTELILALFILLKVPLGLFNVVGVVTLFIGSFLLGKELFKEINYSIVFAVSISLLHGVIRWTLTQKPDILMIASLAFILWIILKERRRVIDFLFLGLLCGLFIGAKFTGPIFLIIILLPFYRNLAKIFSLKNLLFFLVLFVPVGVAWYIRNIIVTGDPVYFPDYRNIVESGSFNYAIRSYIFQPIYILNGYFSEFMLWGIGVIAVPIVVFLKRKKLKEKTDRLLIKFCIGAMGIFIISLTFPYWKNYDQIVFTMRYVLPMIFLVIICIFLIFKKYKMEKLLTISVIPMLVISQMQDYHPKLVIPVTIFIWAIFALSLAKEYKQSLNHPKVV